MKSRFIIAVAFALITVFMMSCATTGDLKKLQASCAAAMKADQALAKADQAARDAAAATAAVQGAQAEGAESRGERERSSWAGGQAAARVKSCGEARRGQCQEAEAIFLKGMRK